MKHHFVSDGRHDRLSTRKLSEISTCSSEPIDRGHSQMMFRDISRAQTAENEDVCLFPRARSVTGTIILCLLPCLLTGCAVVGPRSIKAGRVAYAEAINQTQDEQILLSIVKGRYGDSTTLLAVNGVAANIRFRADVGVEAGFRGAGALIDDVGPAQSSTFGGEIAMPTMDRIAKAGITYNRFHTTAMCSPTRASLLTGRNHHFVGAGVIQELGNEWDGFESFYGFLAGEASQYEPTMVRNTAFAEHPHPSGGHAYYHLSEDIADDAINWLQTPKACAPEKPFFMYRVSGAGELVSRSEKPTFSKT